MILYLVRHANPLSKEQDPQRPLSELGRRQAGDMAAALKGKVEAQHIYHSGKARARQTAEAFSKTLGIHPQSAENLSPMDDPEAWANTINTSAAAGGENIMLVGHLPYMSRLASRLLSGEADRAAFDFAEAGVMCIEGTKGAWHLKWFLWPELL